MYSTCRTTRSDTPTKDRICLRSLNRKCPGSTPAFSHRSCSLLLEADILGEPLICQGNLETNGKQIPTKSGSYNSRDQNAAVKGNGKNKVCFFVKLAQPFWCHEAGAHEYVSLIMSLDAQFSNLSDRSKICCYGGLPHIRAGGKRGPVKHVLV
jgi:hypothetical protein